MIVTGGFYKGKKISAPKGEATRPTSSKVRQAFMNICQLWIKDATFLDIFAGSGAMGLEAISRGARSCVFVESDRQAVGCIKDNIADIRERALRQDFLVPSTRIVDTDFKKSARGLAGGVTIAWADPPYSEAEKYATKLFELVSTVAAEECYFGIEHSRKYPESVTSLAEAASQTGWEMYRSKNYGDTLLTVWKKGQDDE